MRWTKKKAEEWETCFAWFPVQVNNICDEEFIWLEKVKRFTSRAGIRPRTFYKTLDKPALWWPAP